MMMSKLYPWKIWKMVIMVIIKSIYMVYTILLLQALWNSGNRNWNHKGAVEMRLKILLREYIDILPSALAFAIIFRILSHLFRVTCTVNHKCTIECYAINYCTGYFVTRALPLKYHCSRLELLLLLFFFFFTFLHMAFYLTSQDIN